MWECSLLKTPKGRFTFILNDDSHFLRWKIKQVCSFILLGKTALQVMLLPPEAPLNYHFIFGITWSFGDFWCPNLWLLCIFNKVNRASAGRRVCDCIAMPQNSLDNILFVKTGNFILYFVLCVDFSFLSVNGQFSLFPLKPWKYTLSNL